MLLTGGEDQEAAEILEIEANIKIHILGGGEGGDGELWIKGLWPYENDSVNHVVKRRHYQSIV